MIENVNEDNLEEVLLLFETERKSGGGPTAKHEYFDAERTLVIFYEDSKTAFTVLKRKEAIVYEDKVYVPKKVPMNKLDLLRKKGKFNLRFCKMYA